MKIGRQIIVSTIVHFLTFLFGFIGVKILTNTLSVSNYGIYSLIFFTIGTVSIFLDLGFHKYLSTKIPGEEKTKGFSYFTSTFIFETIVLVLFNALVIGIGLPLIRYYNPNISAEIIILSALFLMFNLLVVESLRFHSFRKRLEFSSIMGLFTGKFWVLLLFPFLWFIQKITLDQLLLIRLLPLILALFISLWQMKRKGERVDNNKLFDKNIIVEGLIFGTPLIILGFGNNLLISADRYIIAFFHSTTAVGHYSLVYALVNMGYTFSSTIVGVFFFHFAEAYNLGKQDELQFLKFRYFFNCSLKLSLIVGLFLCAVFALLRSPLIQLFSTKEYLIAAKAMLILSPFPVLLTLAFLFQLVLLLEKQKGVLIKAYIFAPLLNVILNFILIPKFGINGAAIATVISYLFISLFFLFKIRKYHIIKFSKSRFSKLGICLLLAVFPIYLLEPDSVTELLYSGITSVIIYFLSLIILKVVTKEDWEILWGHERKTT